MSLDNSTSGAELQSQISSMTDAEKREIQSFIQNESQKSNIQENIHNLTAMCFTKCVTGTIKQAQLDSREEPCMQNCVQRFMDSNMLTIKHLEKMRN